MTLVSRGIHAWGLLLFLLVAASAGGSRACMSGCPHTLDLVCGADQNTYQSRCLALCQGVDIISDKPCEGNKVKRQNPRAVHLHRLLINSPAPGHDDITTTTTTTTTTTQRQQHANNNARQHQQAEPLLTQGQQHESASDSSSSSSRGRQLSPRLLSQADMQAFQNEGFRLLGLVQLQDTVGADGLENTDLTQGSSGRYASLVGDGEEGDGDSQSDDGGGEDPITVRALRITRSGLLYTASYDLDMLSNAIKEASLRSGLASPPPSPPDRSLFTSGGAAATTQEEEAGEEGAKYASLGDNQGSCTDPTWGHAGRKEEQEEEDGGEGEVATKPNGLPNLPHYDPSQSHHVRREQRRRNLQQQNVAAAAAKKSSPPPSRQVEDVTTTAAAGDAPDPPAMPEVTPVASPPPPPAAYTTCKSQQFPFTAIGQLQLKDSSGAYVCSGSLVSSDAVLTAAHCVFRRDGDGGGAFYSTLDFAAGRYNANNVTYNPYNVTAWAFATIFDTYETVPDTYQFDWDVAIIRLSSPVGYQAGWMGMASGCAVSASTGLPVSSYAVATAGYPSSLPFGSCTASTCSLLRDDCTSRIAYHSCPSLSGQSGSPFYLQKDFRIRGILVGTYASYPNPLKVTHLVGTTSYSALLKWIAEPMTTAITNDKTTNDVTGVASSPLGQAAVLSSVKGATAASNDEKNGNSTQMDGVLKGGLPAAPPPQPPKLNRTSATWHRDPPSPPPPSHAPPPGNGTTKFAAMQNSTATYNGTAAHNVTATLNGTIAHNSTVALNGTVVRNNGTASPQTLLAGSKKRKRSKHSKPSARLRRRRNHRRKL